MKILLAVEQIQKDMERFILHLGDSLGRQETGKNKAEDPQENLENKKCSTRELMCEKQGDDKV